MSLTASQITQAYQKNVERARLAKEEFDRAQERFNEIYTDCNREGHEVTKEFSQQLFNYIKERINFRERYSSVGRSLTEIFTNDEGMEKISFHNRQWVSNMDGGFTFMIRNEKLKSIEGEIPQDMTVEEVGEFLLKQYQELKNKS